MSDLGLTSAPVVDATPSAASSVPPAKRPPRKLATADERRARVRTLLNEALGRVNEALEVMDSRSSVEEYDPEGRVRYIERARASLLRALATPEQLDAEFQAAVAAIAGADDGEAHALTALKAAVIEMAMSLDPDGTPGLELVPAGADIDTVGKSARPTRSHAPRAPVSIVRAGLSLSANQAVR